MDNYNPDSMIVKETTGGVKPGTSMKARVALIETGTLGQFLKPEVLKKWSNAKGEDKAIRVTSQTEDLQYHKQIVLSLPKDGKTIHPKSKLAKWKKMYGDVPREGQEVDLRADDKGYYQYLV